MQTLPMRQKPSFAHLVVAAKTDPKAAMELMRTQAALTLPDAIQGTQLSVIRKADPETAEDAIVDLISNLQSVLNVTNRMSGIQIAQAALDILHGWPFLKIEELAYVFKNARLGVYGKTFNRLDIQIIGEWINAYDHSEEKAAYLERQASAFKQAELAPVKLSEEAIKMQNEMIEKLQARIAKVPKVDTQKKPVVNPLVPKMEDLSLSELEAFVNAYSDTAAGLPHVERAKELIAEKQKGGAA
jgi:hypothetical protein